VSNERRVGIKEREMKEKGRGGKKRLFNSAYHWTQKEIQLSLLYSASFNIPGRRMLLLLLLPPSFASSLIVCTLTCLQDRESHLIPTLMDSSHVA